MDIIILLSKKLKEELNKEELVKQYLEVKNCFENDAELASMRSEIASLQANSPPLYKEMKNKYESHPLVANYYALKDELYDLLKEVEKELKI